MRSLAWLACALLAVGPGCKAGAPAREGRAPAGRRVISLSPSLTRVLVALGAAGEIVAVDRFSTEVPGLGERPALGGVFHTDLERTLELRPTLVLALRSVQQAPLFEQLRARGVRVVEVEVDTLEEVLASFLEIGEQVGRRPEAEALVARVRGDLERVRASVQGLPRPSVALVIERDPLYVVGGGAFLSALIEAAGGRNVFSDLEAAYPRVSLEVLADRAPDLVLDTFFDPARAPDAASDVRSYWKRFAWVRRVEPFPFTATHPAPNLTGTAWLLRDRIQHGGSRP